MKKFSLGIISFLSLLSANVFGQISNVPGLNNEVIRVRKYIDIEGSPYLYTDWKSGVVTDVNNQVYNNEMVKYDAYKDVVEINKEGQTMILNKATYIKFSITFADPNTNHVIHHNFQSGFTKINNYGINDYFEVLSEGKVMLLKKYGVKFIDEVVNSYGTAAQIKRFQRFEKYYMLRDGAAVEIKLSSKSVLGYFENDSRVKAYMATEKIKVRNEFDLIKLVNYYQTL